MSKTVNDVIETMSDEQQKILYFLIGQAVDDSQSDPDGRGGSKEDPPPVNGKTVKDVVSSYNEEQRKALEYLIASAVEDARGTEETLQQSEDDPNTISNNSYFDDPLVHYGVLGMKWGVRKDRRRAGGGSSSTPKKKKRPFAETRSILKERNEDIERARDQYGYDLVRQRKAYRNKQKARKAYVEARSSGDAKAKARAKKGYKATKQALKVANRDLSATWWQGKQLTTGEMATRAVASLAVYGTGRALRRF